MENRNEKCQSSASVNEMDVLQGQIYVNDRKYTVFRTFRYANWLEWLILVISTISALIAGAIRPLMTVIFSQIASTFENVNNDAIAHSDARSKASRQVLYFVYLFIGDFMATYVATAGYVYCGDQIVRKARTDFLRATLRQNVAFFDQVGTGLLVSRMTADMSQIQNGISQRLCMSVSAFSSFVTSFAICFILKWKLALILSWSVFVFGFLLWLGTGLATTYNQQSLEAQSEASAAAEEAISSMRIVAALGMQDSMLRRYDHELSRAEKWGFRAKVCVGLLVGCVVGMNYTVIALALWQGSHMLVDGNLSFKDLTTIILAISMGIYALSEVSSNVESFTSANSSASTVFSIIDRKSPIDALASTGQKLDHVHGHIQFCNVTHMYPTRPGVTITRNLDLEFLPGTRTAIIGPSGSGKSTIADLIERFYEPVDGKILLDGVDIRDLNIHWLRQQIRYVPQSPMLNNVTIFENICQGLQGTQYAQSSVEFQQKLVEAAAYVAHAHDFIMNLPDGYQTVVGEQGSMLSGGQRQRIAVARAIIIRPTILILDEATSALDASTERSIQNTLSQNNVADTIIMITHRFNTVQGCDNIVVIDKGLVLEEGTHDHLCANDGPYYRLWKCQSMVSESARSSDTSIHHKRYSIGGDTLCPPTQASDAPLEHLQEGVKFQQVASSVILRESSDSSGTLIESDVGKEKQMQVYENSLVSPLQDESSSPTPASLFRFLVCLNKPDALIILFGIVCSLIAGAEEPIHAVLFGKALVVIGLPLSHVSSIRQQTNLLALLFFALAILQGLAFSGQGTAFALCSERMVRRARQRAFRAILRQDLAFFDRHENSTGALISLLATEATYLAGVSGTTLGTMLLVVSTLVIAFIVACAFGWKLALVCSTTIPIIMACGWARVALISRLQLDSEKSYLSASTVASEAISSIKMVAACSREQEIIEVYHQQLLSRRSINLRSNLRTSFFYAISLSSIYLCMALGFWYGSTLIIDNEYTTLQFYITYSAVIFGAFSAGLCFTFAPEIGKAHRAAINLMKFENLRPNIKVENASMFDAPASSGHIRFQNISFSYPERISDTVLKNVSFEVFPGQHVAFVGSTGSGKTTVLSLLQRLYDLDTGSIYVDGIDITTLNAQTHRRGLGLVSQEQVLFSGSLRENLLLGLEDRAITDADITTVLNDVALDDFVASLPNGIDTPIGPHGTQLSGGQQQRLSLARALLRDPRILLLDEATSALDANNEQLIEEMLETATQGRTTIYVAHRLRTIVHCDVIHVLDQGSIIESGTHEDLLAMRGKYFELYRAQNMYMETAEE